MAAVTSDGGQASPRQIHSILRIAKAVATKFGRVVNAAQDARCSQNKESCFAAAGRDVDDWRGGWTNYRSADSRISVSIWEER